MSVIKVTKNDAEEITLVTTPRRHYVSSSTGVTGSINVFPRRSNSEVDIDSVSKVFSGDQNYITYYNAVTKNIRGKRAFGEAVYGAANDYMNVVHSFSPKKVEVLDVERFTPTTTLTKYTLCKNNVKDMLMPYYRNQYPQADWAYTNFHSLNFFTAYNGSLSMVPTSSVLLYPNLVDESLPGQEGHVSGSYCLTGAFCFDFRINPRYKTDGTNKYEFRDGTILHLSSSYALSLVTGSKKDPNGYPEGFRIKLQLSHSADYPPSVTSPGVYPHDLTFLSSDNSLTHNHWHHVIVKWGTSLINDGTGSFIVDGVNRGNFVVPSGTIMPKVFSTSLNPDVLCVGNYYEGTNTGVDAQSLFFGARPAKRDGLEQLTNDAVQDEPISYKFAHPLKAEIHDLCIRRRFVSNDEILASGTVGPGLAALRKDDFAFYLPPLFIEDSPIRRWVGDSGGVLQTPFFEIDGTTDDPFNVAMAFGVNGHLINLENFTKDFTTGRFPRLMCLTASSIDYTTQAKEANAFLYSDGGVAKRNLTIMPCDDGNFQQDYSILSVEPYKNKYVELGQVDYSYISLDRLVNISSLANGGAQAGIAGEIVEELYGPSPETPGLPPGPALNKYLAKVTASFDTADQLDRGVQAGMPLTIYQRLLDPSSNQVTFFNFSNLFYGRRILPGSFVIQDASVSGSHGAVSVTLRDDGFGNLYRGDSFTSHSTKNSVGNIFYDEGIVVVKSPHLYFFGKNQYEVSFRGVQNVYSTKYEILAPTGLLNSSSNPTFAPVASAIQPSGLPTDKEPFVYISGLNLHDNNMNVVAKVRLAQPIIKREGDKILFKVALDY